MSFQQTPIYSVLNNKCPHCHEGSFFETNNPYNLRKFAVMNSRCPVCNEDFMREPGYYFGATYVSYALTVGFGIILYILLAAFDVETLPFIIIFSALLIVFLPLLYRSARLIWIHFFVRYKDKN